MLKEILLNLYARDLEKLKTEIGLYKRDEDLWKTGAEIPNSGGNLCLHLIGNLKNYFGATLGNTGFIRNRPGEFSSKNIPRGELMTEIGNAAEVVKNTLQNLSVEDLERIYPEKYEGKSVTTGWMLTHLLTHFDYHRGQINYHRRFFQND